MKIQGIEIADICKKFGTPLYIYDAEIIQRQVRRFKAAFDGIDIHIRYAMKANSNLSIVKYMRSLGTGLDTVSIPEIMMGLELGYPPSEIVFTPNMINFSEIKEAVNLGVHINIENLSNLEKFGMEYGSSIPCCIRMNPQIVAEKEQKIIDWHRQSKFGISLSQLDPLKGLVEKYGIRVNGIHIHSSHVIMSREVFLKGAQIIFDVAREFPHLEYLDFGGGHRNSDDKDAMDIETLGREFKAVFKQFCAEYGKDIQAWFEPGRFLVSEAGALLVNVEVVKTNGTVIFAGVNSGFNHLIRPMFYNAFHEIVNISNPEGNSEQYNIVGNLCEIDNFGIHRFVNTINENDILMIKHAGAYGYCMSSQYNSRFRPAEVLVINGEAKLIRERETINDFKRNQVIIDFP